MFGKMMNRYYYGKSGKGDYTKEDLPQNRWQLFRETLRVRFSSLMRLNMMYAVAWLPALFVIGRACMLGYSGIMNIAAMQAEADAGTMLQSVVAQNMQGFTNAIASLTMQTLLLLIPCLLITGPFTAGLCYVTRNWARDEHAFIWSDFKDAVKENWKQALLTSAITSVMPIIAYVCFQFYGDMAQTNVLFVLPQILCIMVIAIWMCALMYIYPQMITYRLTFRNLIKNSLFLTVARFPMTIGFKLLSLLPLAICAAVGFFTPYMQYALLALALYYVLLGFGLTRFIGASYSNAVFDRFINVKIEGAEVNKGMYVEEPDSDDEADESAKA